MPLTSSKRHAPPHGVSLLALLTGLTTLSVLRSDPVWAGDGGAGSAFGVTKGIPGAGGTDGNTAAANGRNGNPQPSGLGSGGGGGGATNVATGFGGAGGGDRTTSAVTASGSAGESGVSNVAGAIVGGIGTNGTTNIFTGIGTGGGGGGVGVTTGSDVTVQSGGSATGGAGGIGGTASGGGGGGAGVLSSADVTVGTGASVFGGTGGQGSGDGGSGGGGIAVVLGNSGTLTNSGVVTGGTGGNATGTSTAFGQGGFGGAGVWLSDGGTVINHTGATIHGGAISTSINTSLALPTGGVGIEGGNVSIINAGTIVGGSGADAIQFTGGVNSLEIDAGSTIIGNVVAFSPADTFRLGGDANALFLVSNIGLDAQYKGFGIYDKTGASTWTLLGTTTVVTPWTLTAGTLSIRSDGNLGDPSGALTFNGGTLQTTANITMDRATTLAAAGGTIETQTGTDLTQQGQISGPGSLTKTGAGSLTLTADNSYSGGTELGAGTLNAGSNTAIGSGTLAMAAGTTLNLNGSFTLANAITLSGDPTIDIGTGQSNTLSGGISNGTQAGDLVKTGAGTLVLTGADTYTGSTEVETGTLDVEGHLASTVNVVNGAALIGNGSLGGLNVVSGATIAPGNNSIGTLTIDGNVTLASGSKYEVNATDAGSSDLIAAAGTATLGGGSVVAIAAGSHWQPSTQYTILTAAGGVIGSFGAVSSNFAFLTPTLTYDPNGVYLTLRRNATVFPAVGVTPNQRNTGAAVEALSPGNSVFDAVLPLGVVPARSAFAEMSGDNLASTRTAIVNDSRFVRDAINNHLQGDNVDSVWTSAWTHGGSQDSDGNAARMSYTGSGLLVGADRNLDAWRIGAVAGTGELSNNSTHGVADAHSTDTVFGLYAGYSVDAWQFQGGAAHSWYQTRSHRQIDLAGVGATNGGSYDNGVTQVYVDGGYQFTFTQSTLTPYVDLARVWMHQGSINEVGSAAALDVQASGTSVNYGTVGLRGMFSPTPGLQMHANVNYQHAWGDLSSIDTQSFASGDSESFTVAGLPVSRNVEGVDVGMRFAISKSVTADASYHGQFASNMKDEGARLSLNVSL